MFGVGLHFSLKDLLAVQGDRRSRRGRCRSRSRRCSGMALALALGWPIGAGLVFGLALSVASTVVLLRALQERRLIETERGRIAVGWLIVEDLAMVLALVLLPALAGLLERQRRRSSRRSCSAPRIARLALGAHARQGRGLRRASCWSSAGGSSRGSCTTSPIPARASCSASRCWRSRSASPIGAAELFGVSFALGAFFAGMILSESELSQRAAEETLPLRDAFAVLFFVSVGMLFDPTILLREPLPVLATLLIIMVGKSIAAFLIVLAFRYPVGDRADDLARAWRRSASSPSSSPARRRPRPAAGARARPDPRRRHPVDPAQPADLRGRSTGSSAAARGAAPACRDRRSRRGAEDDCRPTALTGHAVLVGYGRVGSWSARRCRPAGMAAAGHRGRRATIVDSCAREASRRSPATPPSRMLRRRQSRAARAAVRRRSPTPSRPARSSSRRARANPDLPIIARAHSDAEVEHLQKLGANVVIMGEREIALAMLDQVLASGGMATRPA